MPPIANEGARHEPRTTRCPARAVDASSSSTAGHLSSSSPSAFKPKTKRDQRIARAFSAFHRQCSSSRCTAFPSSPFYLLSAGWRRRFPGIDPEPSDSPVTSGTRCLGSRSATLTGTRPPPATCSSWLVFHKGRVEAGPFRAQRAGKPCDNRPLGVRTSPGHPSTWGSLSSSSGSSLQRPIAQSALVMFPLVVAHVRPAHREEREVLTTSAPSGTNARRQHAGDSSHGRGGVSSAAIRR